MAGGDGVRAFFRFGVDVKKRLNSVNRFVYFILKAVKYRLNVFNEVPHTP